MLSDGASKKNSNIKKASSKPWETVFTVSVRDTGIGMEPEVMHRIFDPFEQGNRSFEHRLAGSVWVWPFQNLWRTRTAAR